MQTPSISLVIPTRHRPHFLRRLLCSLQLQSFQDFEVLVIDDSDQENEWDLSNEFPPLNIRTLRTSHRGANRARNLGLKLATGNILYFLDDDTYLASPQHLSQLANHFNSVSQPYLAGGMYQTPDSSSLAQWTYNCVCNLWLKKGFRNSAPILLGGNFAVRRKDLNSSIFFSENVFRGGDEIEFHLRFRQAHPDCRIELLPSMSVWHDSNLTWHGLQQNSLSQQKNNPTTWQVLWTWLKNPSFDVCFAFPVFVYVLLGKIRKS